MMEKFYFGKASIRSMRDRDGTFPSWIMTNLLNDFF